MLRNISALIAGLIFGFGLIISQMINPEKVIAFLDIFGNWDPSLAFVMGGAVIVTAIGYPIIRRAQSPVFAPDFHIPESQSIDTKLISGAVLFGVGWGLVGLCPGPAITAILIGGMPVAVFILSMAAGIMLFRFAKI